MGWDAASSHALDPTAAGSSVATMSTILAMLQALALACCTDPAVPSSCWIVSDENDLSDCDPDDVTAYCALDDAGGPIACREATLECIEYTGKRRPYVTGETCEGDVTP